MKDLTETEQQYVDAYVNVCHAVWDCTKYVSNSLAQQVEHLEAQIEPDRIEQLKEAAHRKAATC